jgi:hypothetical protein
MIKLLSEASLNTLRGNIPLNPVQFKKMKNYKQTLRTMAHRKIPIQEKRQFLLTQRGGFLPALIPIIASTVGGLLSGL